MDRNLKLKGARVALTSTHSERLDLLISRGRILPFDNSAAVHSELDLSGHLLLPGLLLLSRLLLPGLLLLSRLLLLLPPQILFVDMRSLC